jgi:hypothetical protein
MRSLTGRLEGSLVHLHVISTSRHPSAQRQIELPVSGMEAEGCLAAPKTTVAAGGVRTRAGPRAASSFGWT